MDRELLLVALVLIVAAPLLWASGLVARPIPLGASARATERARWVAVWAPALLPALTACALVGWAHEEPADAEAIGVVHIALLAPFALVWLRAAARAGWSLAQSKPDGPAATVGLVRPRVMIDPRFLAGLDERAATAVVLHERAHAAAFDPLRIWAAGVVTDLQWPLPASKRRLAEWRGALELARDEDARLAGADGPALAEAIVACATFGRVPTTGAPFALLEGSDSDLTARIARLLGDDVAPFVVRPRWRLLPLALALPLAASALAAGSVVGERAVRLLLEVSP